MDLSSDTSRFWRERILITVKTYPTPHPTHHEAVCTAGINEAGEWRRLWPIPFRYLEKGRQFRRYEWIDVALRKQSGDPRPESHVVDPDTIVCDGFVDASRTALRHVHAHGEIANRQCRDLLGLPSAQTAWRLLSVLVRDGALQREGTGRGSKYVIPKRER